MDDKNQGYSIDDVSDEEIEELEIRMGLIPPKKPEKPEKESKK